MNIRNTLFIENNNLYIGGVNACDLARKFGTPLYVMDADYIESVCGAFKDTMSAYGDGAVAFVSKAFATLATVKLISRTGLWFEAVSGGELFLLNNAGVDMTRVLFNGNNKTEKEITEGVDLNVKYFVVDSFPEIDSINRIAGESGKIQEVLLRVNPCVTAHTHEAVITAAPTSKFGFGLAGDAQEAIAKIFASKNLCFKGLHLHIGSQIYDHTAYDAAIEVITDFMQSLHLQGIETDILDMGGGYGIYYTDEDPKFTPKRYAYILKNICDNVKSGCEKKGLKKPFLIVEPGRSIVGEAGITLYTVGSVKKFKNDDKVYVVTDGGMFENPRYALYEAKYSAVIANKAAEQQTETVTLAGKCCESGDIIAKDILLQKAEKGDIAAVFSTGAYNYSMASNYNLNAVPPVVLVKNGKADYIVKPQTYADLIRNNTVPEWLND